MFDFLINKLSGEKGIDVDVNLKELLIKKFYYLPNSSDLYISIALWSGGLDYLCHLRKKVKQRNASFLEFKLSSEILSSDTEETLSRFYFLEQQIVNQVKLLHQQYGFDKIHLIGISMGCVTVSMIAHHNSFIDKIILIVPGDSLAEPVWKGIRSQHLKKIIESNGISLKDLKQKWHSLAPENNLDGMEKKEIIVYFSQSDRIIPGEFGECLVNKMYKKNLSPLVCKNKYLGHYGTMGKFFMFPNLGI